jgi:hypothetical protein
MNLHQSNLMKNIRKRHQSFLREIRYTKAVFSEGNQLFSMKNLSLFLIVLCLAITSQAQLKRYQVAVIGFYNLENLYDTIDNPITLDDEFTPSGAKKYNTIIFRDKLNKLASVIKDIGTDYHESGVGILGVAEIENDTVLQFLVQHPLLKKRNYHIVHASSKDLRGVDVGLLYQPSFFIPMDAQKLFVPLPGRSKDASFTRDILYVKGLMMTDTFHIYMNHWPSRRGGEERSSPARMAAASICRKHIDSIQMITPDAKIVVMGDLNDDPEDKSIVEGLHTKSIQEALKQGELYNPWVEQLKKGNGTLAHKDNWGLFDQILLSKSLLNREANQFFFFREHIYNKSYLTEYTGRFKGYPMRTWEGNRYRGGYSDHFPVYTVLVRQEYENQ